MADKQFIVSIGPHIKDRETTARIMWTVNASLLPAAIAGAFFFGPRAIVTMVLCIVAAVGGEFLYQRAMHKKITIRDGSALLTGLLLSFNLPPSVPWYIPILGSGVAIVLAKQLFGGLGYNIFNPALLGRAFLLISFPRILTTWIDPNSFFTGLDGITCATPLNILKMEGVQRLIAAFNGKASLYLHLIDGHHGGCIGETCFPAILAGAVFLLYKKYITWHIPLSFIATAALLAWIFGGKTSLFSGDPVIHIFSGGIILSAFFMATDYVTSPSLRGGQLLFGAGCGFITMLVRLKGGYPEGAMFSILIMNCFSPLIDRAFRPKPFGNIVRVVK